MIICYDNLHTSALTDGDLTPGVPAEGPLPNPPLQEIHLTLIVLSEGGQSPDLDLPAGEDPNPVLPGEGQGLGPLPGSGQDLDHLPGSGQDLEVQDTAVAVSVGQGHDRQSHAGREVGNATFAGERYNVGVHMYVEPENSHHHVTILREGKLVAMTMGN